MGCLLKKGGTHDTALVVGVFNFQSEIVEDALDLRSERNHQGFVAVLPERGGRGTYAREHGDDQEGAVD